MNKLILCILLSSITLFGTNQYSGSTLAPVILAGGIIKVKSGDVVKKKYKRSQCPVCKGKGWYISGDGIEKVDCGYCEVEASASVIRR